MTKLYDIDLRHKVTLSSKKVLLCIKSHRRKKSVEMPHSILSVLLIDRPLMILSTIVNHLSQTMYDLYGRAVEYETQTEV